MSANHRGRLTLVKPGKEHEAQLQAYIQEHLQHGEADLHGGALLETMAYDDWLQQLRNHSCPATVSPDWVPSTTFLALCQGAVVGMIDIRHRLNEFLASYGGHIGYGIRPTMRNQGYATELLGLGLGYCKTIALSRVMLTCYKENLASRKTIQTCGGILEREFLYQDGKIVEVYWIPL